MTFQSLWNKIGKTGKKEERTNIELEISFKVEYAIRGDKETAVVNLRDIKSTGKGIEYGVIGNDELYDWNKIKKVVSKIVLKRNMPLYLFAEDKSGRRRKFGIDISKKWPDELTEYKNISTLRKVTIKI